MDSEDDPLWWQTVIVFYPYASGALLGPICLVLGWHLVAWVLAGIGFINIGKRFNGSLAHQGQLLANLVVMVISMCFMVWGLVRVPATVGT
jgi:hypothetical protein